MIRAPPNFTLFPYTTLFRSGLCGGEGAADPLPADVLAVRLEVGDGARLQLLPGDQPAAEAGDEPRDRKSTRLNSSHPSISYAVFCLKKKITLIATCRDAVHL